MRYRRSAGEERLQLKWFAYATALSLGLMFALLPVAPMGRRGRRSRLGHSGRYRAGTPGGHRHRRAEVPALRDRPDHLQDVSYTLVTGLVVGVYLGCVAVLTRVLAGPRQRRHRGRGAGRRRAVQPAAPAGAGRGRPAVRPGPLHAERVVAQFSFSCATRSTSTRTLIDVARRPHKAIPPARARLRLRRNGPHAAGHRQARRFSRQGLCAANA